MKTYTILLALFAAFSSPTCFASYKVGAMAKYEGTFQTVDQDNPNEFTLSFLVTQANPELIERSGSVNGVELPKDVVSGVMHEDVMGSGGVDYLLGECSPKEKHVQVIDGKEIEVCTVNVNNYPMKFADVPFGLVEAGDSFGVFKETEGALRNC